MWRTKPKAMAELEDEVFGKRILFTDREDWSITEVVAGYRSQWNVEADFRQMKDPKVVSLSPMFHWTDAKIRVHVMHCVLALVTARLMVRDAERVKMAMSVRELLSTLAGIEETVLLYQGDRGRPRARRMLTDLGPTPTLAWGNALTSRHSQETPARSATEPRHPLLHAARCVARWFGGIRDQPRLALSVGSMRRKRSHRWSNRLD